MFLRSLVSSLVIGLTALSPAQADGIPARRLLVAEAPFAAPVPQQQPTSPKSHPAPTSPTQDPKSMEAAAVVALLIAASVVGYTGNCSCPQNTDKAGRSCGKRSAYNRPNGWKPLCFATDVTPQMVDRFRQTGKAAAALELLVQR